MKSVRELSLVVEELMEDSCIDNESNLLARLTARCHQYLMEMDSDLKDDVSDDDSEEDEQLLISALSKICEKTGLEEEEYYDLVQEIVYAMRDELN